MKKTAILAALLAANAIPAFAATPDELKAKGEVRIGVFSDKPPFGYVDANGVSQGFDVEIGRYLTKQLLGDEAKAKFVLVEAANRVEYLRSNKVDIILANFTVTPERAEVVDYAKPYMKVALGVVSPDKAPIKSIDELQQLKEFSQQDILRYIQDYGASVLILHSKLPQEIVVNDDSIIPLIDNRIIENIEDMGLTVKFNLTQVSDSVLFDRNCYFLDEIVGRKMLDQIVLSDKQKIKAISFIEEIYGLEDWAKDISKSLLPKPQVNHSRKMI